jgi:hypothetical protein
MGLLKYANSLSDDFFLLAIIIIAIFVGYVLIVGTIGLFLLSVAFPNLVTFEFDLIRIIALGILLLILGLK